MRAIAMRDLVRRLLKQEAADIPDHENLAEAAERVFDKLRAHLSKRVGQEGFRTLLARALTLTTPSFPFLSTVRVEKGGLLVGLREACDSPETAEGAVALVASLLQLLILFIGQELTGRILSAIWPGLVWNDADDWENE